MTIGKKYLRTKLKKVILGDLNEMHMSKSKSATSSTLETGHAIISILLKERTDSRSKEVGHSTSDGIGLVDFLSLFSKNAGILLRKA